MSDPFNTLMDTIVDRLKEHLSGLRECRRHPGRFTRDELERYGTATPAVFLSFLGVTAMAEASGEVDATLRLAAYLVASDQRDATRDQIVLAMGAELAVFLPDQCWELSNAHPIEAKSIRVENLYGSSGRNGVVLCGVEWRQTIRVGTNAFEPWTGSLVSVTAHGPDGAAATFGEASDG